ncbi:MAG TPA: J domain-containing protein [Caulobacteraceae bacterium]|nr:J domain-containing protein [Caulobacteraceae bacterium]
MILVALAVLALAALVGLGRKPLMGGLMARAQGRYAAVGMAAVAIAAAAWDAVRGGWLGGSILATAALWLVTSASRPRVGQVRHMGLAEAASMLGVAESADLETIEAAYRRLMFRVHPDQGGAAGLAAQLNAARAAMLAAKGR